MANGNDPANIPYIIAENGFYYVAYKEKVKVPEVVVSSKGVANGLSEEYNDGWDFGPDSYSPTSTSAIPYTQTTGIQEAIGYCYSNDLHNIRLLEGKFTVNTAKFLGSEVAPWLTGNTTDTVDFWGSILIPELTPDGNAFILNIEGTVMPITYSFSSTGSNNQGTIIYIPDTTVQQVTIATGSTQALTYYSAIIGDTVISNTGFVSNIIHMSNLTVRFGNNNYTNCTFNGVDGKFSSELDLDFVNVDIEGYTTNTWNYPNDFQPSNGIVSPTAQNLINRNVWNNTSVFGFYNGYQIGGDLVIVNDPLCYDCRNFFVTALQTISTPLVINRPFIEGCIAIGADVDGNVIFINRAVLYRGASTITTAPQITVTGSGYMSYTMFNMPSTGGEYTLPSNIALNATGSSYKFKTEFYGYESNSGNSVFTPSLSANPPVSGTVYQNTNNYFTKDNYIYV